MSAKGIKALGAFGFVAKTKGAFNIGFGVPGDSPVFRKIFGTRIVVPSNTEYRNRAALSPRGNLIVKRQ